MAKNKVVFGDQTLIDITDTTASTSTVMSGEVFYGADGERYVGELEAGGVIISDTTDSHGGTIREITTIDDPVMLQEKTVTPTTSTQIVTPDRYGDLVESGVTLEGNSRRTSSASTTHNWQMVGGESYVVVGSGSLIGVPITINDEIVWPTTAGAGVSLEFSPNDSSSWPYSAHPTGIYLTSTGAVITYSASGDNFGSIVIDVYEAGGYHGLNQVTVNPIPSQYIVPSGTSTILSNGAYDVGAFASAIVSVPVPSGSKEITENGLYDISSFAYARVDVSGSGDFEALINRAITSVSNDTLSGIGQYAFAKCGLLQSVNFPNVTSVGSYAFMGTGLSGVVSFPEVITIWYSAFQGCKMQSAYFPKVQVVGYSAFHSCPSLTTASFPEATQVGVGAFAYCNRLSDVSMSNLKVISESAFYSCTNLGYASFPEVSYIGASAFYGAGLTSISVPKATSINNYAFAYCRNLSEFGVSLNMTSLGSYAFFSCSNLENISFPNLTLSTGDYTFYNCSKLSSVNFPNLSGAAFTGGGIGISAFYNCTGLIRVDASKCGRIGSSAFFGCSSLRYLNTPGVQYIGSYALARTAIESASFPLLESCYIYAFSACGNLSYVNFSILSQIPSYAFANCSQLQTAYLPSVGIVYQDAFSNCSMLSSINLPEVKTASMRAFAGCSQLSLAIMPMASSFYSSAFLMCTRLMSLYLLGSSVCRLGNVNVFASTPISTYTTDTGGVNGSIYVPASLYSAYIVSTNWTTYSARFVSLTDAEIEALDF